MTNINYTPERIKGKHLTFEEKEEILRYKEKGYSMRHIAKIIGITPQTVINEINRGTVKQAKLRQVRLNITVNIVQYTHNICIYMLERIIKMFLN